MNFSNNILRFNRAIKLPIIMQNEIAECGHACVTMISQFWGHKIDLYGLRKISKPSTNGVNLKHINQLCERLGFKTRALRVSLNEINLIKTPAILHWNMNHFVVLKKIKKNKVTIHDPAIGIRIYNLREISQSFTGVALEIEKSHDFQPIRNQQKIGLYDIVKTVPGIKKLLGLLLLISISIEILVLLNPLFLQYVTDQVIGSNSMVNLYTVTSGFIIFVLLHTLAEYTRGNLIIYTTTHVTESFRSNVFKHILKLPTVFFESRHQGDIQSKFQSIDQIQSKISTDFINTILDGLMIAINIIVMLIYSRVLTLIVLTALIIYVALRSISYHSLKNKTSSSIYLHTKVATIFLETLRAISPIKLFLKENGRFNTWRNGYVDALNSDIQVSKQQVIYRSANQFLLNFEHIIVICVGIHLVLIKHFSIGMLLAFLSYRLMLVNKSFSFIQNLFDYQLISIQLNRLSDILFHEPEQVCTNKTTLKPEFESLSIKSVEFKYNQENMILNKISFDIFPGEKIAIVGPSGCGKSTLLKIIMGLLPPTSGSVCINNIPIEVFGLNNYRNITAAVIQNDSLLTGSILDNITFFDDEIDLERIYYVAKISKIHDMIMMLPMRYETIIGDMGSTLSGGQKQRLLLARALYKQPTILFLDEATCHVDYDNEQLINKELCSLKITLIMVAHRKETIQMADRVISLSSG